jgi:hypothetical protein
MDARSPRPRLDLVVLDCSDASALGRFYAEVLAARARVHEHQPSSDGSSRVYLDPAGHPFGLVAG